MKLVISVVQVDDVQRLVQALVERGHRATIINTTGGFLRKRNSTVLTAVEDNQVPSVLHIIRRTCRARTEQLSPVPSEIEPEDLHIPASVEVGGATVFVLKGEHYERS